MPRWKETFNDENAFEEDEEENLEGYDEESDWLPEFMEDDEIH
mgnify:CR=1 FL=1